MLPFPLPLSACIALHEELPRVHIDPPLRWVQERAVHWIHRTGLSVPMEAHLFDLLDFSDAIHQSRQAVSCSIEEEPRFHRLVMNLDGRQFRTHANIELRSTEMHSLALTELLDRKDPLLHIQVSLPDRPLLATALTQAGNRALAQGRGALRDALHDVAVQMIQPLGPLFGLGNPFELAQMLHNVAAGMSYSVSPHGKLTVGTSEVLLRETHLADHAPAVRGLLHGLAARV